MIANFYFAWCQPTDTTFTPAMQRWDALILSAEMSHDEAGFAMLTIEIPNPFIGLLNSHRLYWAHFAVNSTTLGVVHLFFGRLVGIPDDLMGEVITLKFIARPVNFFQQKQKAAEVLKVLPGYDPVFVDVLKRDNPDTILEGYSRLFHIDPRSLAVTTSDICIGEDGTVDFTGIGDAFYDSVRVKILEPALTAVAMKMTLNWEQRWTGYFDVTSGQITTFTGESFSADWPKVGASLGGGYSVDVGWSANATANLEIATTLGNTTVNVTYQNTAKTHADGDLMSYQMTVSQPSTLTGVPGKWYTVFLHDVPGIFEPFATDGNGNPAPINQPASIQWTAMYIANWQVSYALTLRYQANRKRTERVSFVLNADVQPVITDPLVTEDTQTITLTSSDLSMPLIDLLNWSSVAGQSVGLGQVIFPDNPTIPGQTSSQIAVQAGTAGLIEPIFSNVAGDTTVDGGVIWSSMGDTPPVESANDWPRQTNVALGTPIIPQLVIGIDYNSLLIPGTLVFPPTGAFINAFEVITNGDSIPGGLMMECIDGGIYGGPTLTDPHAYATFNDFTNPSGQFLYIATKAGQTGLYRPTMNETPGSTTSDGSVIWTNIGAVTLPIGGTPGMTPARSYITTSRGQGTLGNGIMRCRALMRHRARAVNVSWECPYENAVTLTCRKNGSLADRRLPGGGAAGKIISYKLYAHGDTGVTKGSVTIGCSVGFGNAIHFSPGVPTYVDGYVDGYQQTVYTTAQLYQGPDDVGYAPPIEGVVDDGLVFPARKADLVLDETWHGSQDAEKKVVDEAITQAIFNAYNGVNLNSVTPNSSSVGTLTIVTTAANIPAYTAALVNAKMAGSGLWYEVSLKPLTAGPYEAAYVIQLTNLSLPMTINLQA
jgi:hypothetical protein